MYIDLVCSSVYLNSAPLNHAFNCIKIRLVKYRHKTWKYKRRFGGSTIVSLLSILYIFLVFSQTNSSSVIHWFILYILHKKSSSLIY